MFGKRLSQEARERLSRWQEQVDKARALDDKELAAVAENTFRNAAFPHSRHALRGQPVYDSILTEEEFMEKVDAWHESDTDKPIHEWMGITWDEYKALVRYPVGTWKNTDPRLDINKRATIVVVHPTAEGRVATLARVETKHSWSIFMSNPVTSRDNIEFVGPNDEWDDSWRWAFAPPVE